MRSYWLIIGILSVWRVTHLLSFEDGPWQLMARTRRRAGAGVFAGLLGCFYCLSLWIAAPVSWLIGEDWKERAFLWLAFSGGAILLERATAGREAAPPVMYKEDEDDDGMLRKK